MHSLEHLKSRYESYEQDVARLLSVDEFQKTIAHFDKLLEKMAEEVVTLPIGYRYSGIFYIKSPYKYPVEFEKIEGSAFMREDISSWQLYKSNGEPIHGYVRLIYREPNFESEIKKSDKLINEEKPWEKEGDKLISILSALSLTIAQIGFDLQPFLPNTANKILTQFTSDKITSSQPLFPRLP